MRKAIANRAPVWRKPLQGTYEWMNKSCFGRLFPRELCGPGVESLEVLIVCHTHSHYTLTGMFDMWTLKNEYYRMKMLCAKHVMFFIFSKTNPMGHHNSQLTYIYQYVSRLHHRNFLCQFSRLPKPAQNPEEKYPRIFLIVSIRRRRRRRSHSYHRCRARNIIQTGNVLAEVMAHDMCAIVFFLCFLLLHFFSSFSLWLWPQINHSQRTQSERERKT